MLSYRALELFHKQLERHISSDSFATKVVMLPSSVDEKGLTIQLAAQKVRRQAVPAGVRTSRFLKVRVSVKGTAESLTGLAQAIGCIDALDDYLGMGDLHLEDESGSQIPNTRVVQRVSDEDSFLDSPDSTDVQDVEDVRMVEITFPVSYQETAQAQVPAQDGQNN